MVLFSAKLAQLGEETAPNRLTVIRYSASGWLVSIRPPAESQEVHILRGYSDLVKHCYHAHYVSHYSNGLLAKHLGGFLNNLGLKAVLWCVTLKWPWTKQYSQKPLIIFLVGWYTPCCGMYHTRPSCRSSWSWGTFSACPCFNTSFRNPLYSSNKTLLYSKWILRLWAAYSLPPSESVVEGGSVLL